MSVGESLRKTVSYFGGGAGGEYDEGYDEGDYDEGDDDTLTSQADFERHFHDRLDVHRLSTARGTDYDDIYRDERPQPPASAWRAGEHRLSLVQSRRTTLCLVVPRDFDDAQQIADRFRNATPVIVNMQDCETDLTRRLIDFCSGVTYALDGSLERIAEKVFLLAPRDVELSSAEAAGILGKSFFNQI
ncbi:MAG: cell division protein SepF [Thermoleophilia bacterium]